MDTQKYELLLLGITQKGEWYLFSGNIEKIGNNTWLNPSDCTKAIISPDMKTKGILIFRENTVESISIDAAIPVLHGKNGEDGTIQGLLALAGIPIVGCGILASALCMDKNKAHKLVMLTGIKVPKSLVFGQNIDVCQIISQVHDLNYPLFVKPVKSGSSFGITKVLYQEDLATAIFLAYQHDNEIIIEENIDGFEVGCAVLGNDDLTVGLVDEVELLDGFFDYKEKYNLISSSIHVPARIPAHKAEEIKEIAKVIYTTLGCSGFARVDMFLTPNGDIYFNEVNTIPGFTEHSRYPNMLKAIGMTFEQIIDEAISLALPQ